jgi:hypothetical protein
MFVTMEGWVTPVTEALGACSALAAVFLIVLITQLARQSRGSCNTLRIVRVLAAVDALFAIQIHLFLAVGGGSGGAAAGVLPRGLCVESGVLSQFLLVANALLNLVIAVDVCRLVRRPLHYRPDAWRRRYLGGALGLALLAAVVPLLVPGEHGGYDAESAGVETEGASCWLRAGWQLLFYAPLFAAWLGCAAAVVFFGVKLRRAVAKRQPAKLGVRQRLLRRMAFFSAMFVLEWLPQSIVRGCSWGSWGAAGAASPGTGAGGGCGAGDSGGLLLLRVVARLFTSCIGMVDAAVWYGPVCAQAAREQAEIWSLAVLRRRLGGACGAAAALLLRDPPRTSLAVRRRPAAPGARWRSSGMQMLAEEEEEDNGGGGGAGSAVELPMGRNPGVGSGRGGDRGCGGGGRQGRVEPRGMPEEPEAAAATATAACAEEGYFDPEDGFTPLHYAMLDGDAAALAAALAAGAEVDAQDELGVAPLLSAATDGREALVAVLLAAGADVELSWQSGDTPLLEAARGGHAAVVARLLGAGAAVDRRNARGDGARLTPLHEAARAGHAAAVEVLLAGGADAEAVVVEEEEEGAGYSGAASGDRTALSIARQLGHDEVVALLLAAVAVVVPAAEEVRAPLAAATGAAAEIGR